MLLCRRIVPLVCYTRSHCFLLPLQCITSSFLAICQLSAPDIFQHKAFRILPSPRISLVLEAFWFCSLNKLHFFAWTRVRASTHRKKLLVSTSRDMKIAIFSLGSIVLVRFICFSHHSAEREKCYVPHFTDPTIQRRHVWPSQYSSAPYKHIH